MEEAAVPMEAPGPGEGQAELRPRGGVQAHPGLPLGEEDPAEHLPPHLPPFQDAGGEGASGDRLLSLIHI